VLFYNLSKVCFFEPPFSIRNGRKTIKPSKDSDYSLVSKHIKTKNDLLGGAQGQVTSAKNAWTYPSYEVIDKKNEIQNLPIFKNLN